MLFFVLAYQIHIVHPLNIHHAYVHMVHFVGGKLGFFSHSETLQSESPGGPLKLQFYIFDANYPR